MAETTKHVIAAIDYIEGHLHEKSDLETVANALHYSKYHLHRMFTEAVGLPIGTYVQRRRLTEAAKLLVFSDKPILEIALTAGYESQQSFTDIFRAMYKKPPNQFREEEAFYPLQLRYELIDTCGGAGTSRKPGTSEKPGISRKSGISRKPEVSREPRISGKSGASQEPGISRKSEVSREPGILGKSGASGKSETSGISEKICWRENIVSATDTDIPAWMALVRLVIDGFPCLDEKQYLGQLQDSIRNRRAWILKEDGIVIGSMIFDERTGNLEFLGVHPQYRKRGIAKAFCEKALYELARSEQITVTTFREGDKADTGYRKAWKSLGFGEAELLVEFGYPTQRFRLQKSRNGLSGPPDSSVFNEEMRVVENQGETGDKKNDARDHKDTRDERYAKDQKDVRDAGNVKDVRNVGDVRNERNVRNEGNAKKVKIAGDKGDARNE